MNTALFSFDDRAGGQRAAARLAGLGLPADHVRLHLGERRPDENIGSETDEVLTGGFVGNLKDLLQRLFEWGEPGDPSSAWREIEQRGGSVVEVRASSEAERTRVEQLVQSLGGVQRTPWRDPTPG